MASSVFIWPGFFTANGTTINPLFPIALPDGIAVAPSLTWASETNSGWYRGAAGLFRFSIGGADTFELQTSGTVWAKTNSAQIGMGASFDTFFTRASAGNFGVTNAWNIGTSGIVDQGVHTITAGSTIAAGGLTPAGTVGTPVVTGYGDTVAATNTGTASIATFTVGASDRTFEVGANCLITTSTTHSFSLDCTYTDEGNTARTLVLPVTGLTATFLTNGLMTNVTGAGPYESSVMTIRAKAATVITIRTSAGGTYTTVVYNARGVIKAIS